MRDCASWRERARNRELSREKGRRLRAGLSYRCRHVSAFSLCRPCCVRGERRRLWRRLQTCICRTWLCRRIRFRNSGTRWFLNSPKRVLGRHPVREFWRISNLRTWPERKQELRRAPVRSSALVREHCLLHVLEWKRRSWPMRWRIQYRRRTRYRRPCVHGKRPAFWEWR